MIGAMAIFLDDQPEALAGDDLGAVLDAARRKLVGTGRMVVEVHLNGRVLAGDELDTARPTAVSSAEVKLYTADPTELAIVILQQVQARLDDARAAQEQAAELLQTDKSTEAMQRIADAITAWQQTQQAVLQCAALVQIDITTRQVQDRPVMDTIQRLLEQLRQMRDMLSAGDTVGVADALAYEWSGTTRQWQELIGEMIAWIADEKSSG